MNNRYTDGTYLARWPDWGVIDSPWKARQVLRMLEKHRLSPRTIGEVGCGAGEVLRQISASLPNALCEGYEISPQAFAMCTKRESATLHFYLEDLRRREVHFDLLLAIDVFEHVEDYLGFLTALHSKALHFIFHVPLDLYVLALVMRNALTTSRDKFGHLHYFNTSTALATLETAGYSIMDSFLTCHGEIQRPNVDVPESIVRLLRRSLRTFGGDALTQRLLGGYSILILAQ